VLAICSQIRVDITPEVPVTLDVDLTPQTVIITIFSPLEMLRREEEVVEMVVVAAAAVVLVDDLLPPGTSIWISEPLLHPEEAMPNR
jgi:hypothetical protein